jgi:hypothetical protein
LIAPSTIALFLGSQLALVGVVLLVAVVLGAVVVVVVVVRLVAVPIALLSVQLSELLSHLAGLLAELIHALTDVIQAADVDLARALAPSEQRPEGDRQVERYPDPDYDDGDEVDMDEDLDVLTWHSGYGQALLDAEAASSGDRWGERIVDAADRMASKDLWEPQTTEEE